MKKLIRQILREDQNTSVLKKYILGIFEGQVNNGIIPHIPVMDFKRKKLYSDVNFKLINDLYIDFVGGIDKAKDNFYKSVEDVTDKDFKEVDLRLSPEDKFKIIIPWMDFDKDKKFITFGFAIKDCNLLTDRGRMSYEDLLSNDDDMFWDEVTGWLMIEVESYIERKASDFALNGYDSAATWSD